MSGSHHQRDLHRRPHARADDAADTTSKGGLEAMTRTLAAELGPEGINVNAIAPGYFATETNIACSKTPRPWPGCADAAHSVAGGSPM